MAPVIEVKNLITQFGTKRVHDTISFEINRSEVVALIGGSGSGKSTILREILGLLRPTSGSTVLLGCDIWNSSQIERESALARIGVLFQDGALFSALTVGENIAVPMQEQMRLPLSVINELIKLRLNLAGLSADAAALMPSELSGGMRKRAGLARALALEPEVLFLDEPTSGLDPINARAFDALIRTLASALGLTIFLVTHDLDTLTSIVDRIIVLGSGEVIADGTLHDIMRSSNPWVQEYFSSRREIKV